ncbi:MAG: prolyl oligopeptidase family serine peptidase [Stagnimonas sp.]|nr:prolyl oligopeptidase family serine peptidase [Stagnimonas sp.]
MNDRFHTSARRGPLRALALWLLPLAALAVQPPAPRATDFSETIHGVEIRDPYRWMEQGGAEFDDWIRAESAFTEATLAALPGRAALQAEVGRLMRGDVDVGIPKRGGGRLLHHRPAVGDAPPRPYLREADGRERDLPDLLQLHAKGTRHALVPHAQVLSPTGRHLTVGITRDGEADPVLRVFDLDTGQYLPEIIQWPLWADYRGFRPRWLADGSGFFYVRNPQRTAATPEVEREWHGRVYLHRLGTLVARDTAVFGEGINAGVTDDDTPYVEGVADPNWLIITLRQPNGRQLWAAPIARDGSLKKPMRKLLTSPTAFGGWGLRGNTLYALTPQGALDQRLVSVDMSKPTAGPLEMLPAGDNAWSGLAVARDAVYVSRREGGVMSLHRLGDHGALHEIALPQLGTVSQLRALEGGGVEFVVDTWLTAPQWLSVAPGADRAVDTGLMPPLNLDTSAYVAERVLAPARDGVEVPVTLLRRRDLPRNAQAPVILHAYGCFGSTQDSYYDPARLAWLDRGGIYAVAHVRGGGDLGTRWHLAGRDRNKPTAMEDIIDSATHLVRLGWTRPGRIAGEGESCGGLTVGRAALERPDLFGAAVLAVAQLDDTRGGDAAYRRSIFDFGDPDTPEGLRRIKALSPYHAILPGAATPALLLINGANDYTIPLWQAGKFIARARANSANGAPALLRVNWSGGHGIHAGDDDPAAGLTDLYAFLLWRFGDAAFLPPSQQ